MSTSRLCIASRRVLTALAVLLLLSAPASAELVQCAGCRTGSTLMAHLQPAFHNYSGLDIDASEIGNDLALDLLARRQIDLVFASLDGMDLAQRPGIDQQAVTRWSCVPVAMDAIVVVIHPAAGVSELSLEQLAGIFQGRYARWTELGGTDLPVVPVILDEALDCGVAEVFQELTIGRAGVLAARAKRLMTPSQLGHFTQATAGAVTFMAFKSYEAAFGRVATVAGVRPGRESALDGSYPLTATYSLIFDNESAAKAHEVLGFLTTAEGTALVDQVLIALDPSGGPLP